MRHTSFMSKKMNIKNNQDRKQGNIIKSIQNDVYEMKVIYVLESKSFFDHRVR